MKGPGRTKSDSSLEEGECSRSVSESQDAQDDNDKTIVNVCNYSSFVDTSREEGECSSTSCDTTIVKVTENGIESICKGKKHDLEHCNETPSTVKKGNKKRKRSISDVNENTPKRQHLFKTDDMSPICFLNDDHLKDEATDTPLIEFKVSHSEKNEYSSTPISNRQKKLFPKSGCCSTPKAYLQHKTTKATKTDRFLEKDILSDSDTEVQISTKVQETASKYQIVGKLINDITQLCEESDELANNLNQDVLEKSSENISKIELCEIIHGYKTRSVCESGTKGNDDPLVKDDYCRDNDGSNLTIVAAEVITRNELSSQLDTNESIGRGGRFKSEITVSRIEEDKLIETSQDVVDIDVGDKDEEEVVDDLLKLNDYDDEGFIDENALENSHLIKDFSMTKQITTESTNDGKGNNEDFKTDALKNNQAVLKEDSKIKSKPRTDQQTEGVLGNVVSGIDYAVFDASIYRKTDNTEIEKEVCRRWGTHGSADPEVNLTLSASGRKFCNEPKENMFSSRLEGSRVVGTNFYDQENYLRIVSFKKSKGQSDLFFMTIEELLVKLREQKQINENLKKTSLMNIKDEMQCELDRTENRHSQEIAALKRRQYEETEMFRCNSRHMYNPIKFQNCLIQLKNEHLYQERRLQQHQRYEYEALRLYGLQILNTEITQQEAKGESADQLIKQLENSDKKTHATGKHGPPILVNFRKGPCRASAGKHSTVAVCLSAGIAQAVSLEDDIYDHYYSY